MTILNVTEARANLYNLVDDTTVSHEPVVITGKRGNAVLLAEDDWNAINETLHLLSVPGMRESIIEGKQETLDDCANELDWSCGRFTSPNKRKKMHENWPPLVRRRRHRICCLFSNWTLGKIRHPTKSWWEI